MGAPAGNQNRIVTGRYALTLGKLPRKLRLVQSQVWAFRRHIEDAVLQIKPVVGPYEAALINTAAAWQRHSLLTNKWLRESLNELTTAEKVMLSRDVAKAAAERDRALRALGLDIDGPETLDALYESPAGFIDDEADDEPGADDEPSDEPSDDAAGVLDVASTGSSSSVDDAARDEPSVADEPQSIAGQGDSDD